MCLVARLFRLIHVFLKADSKWTLFIIRRFRAYKVPDVALLLNSMQNSIHLFCFHVWNVNGSKINHPELVLESYLASLYTINDVCNQVQAFNFCVSV